MCVRVECVIKKEDKESKNNVNGNKGSGRAKPNK